MANNTIQGSTQNSPGDSKGKPKMKKGNNQIAIGAFDRGDYATALGVWRPLAEQGNAVAQSNLGAAYATGQGVSQDFSEAVKWFRLAAEQGNAFAQSRVGVAYATGQGVAQDESEAVKWFRLAAKQGHAEARINLRLMNALPLDRDTLKRSATFGSRTQRSRASLKTKH